MIEMLYYSWKPALEVFILWFLIYHIMLFFEGTRAIQVLRGIIILLLAFFIFQKFDFIVLDWLFSKLFAFSILAILVIFHPEIRQGLARLGQRHLFETPLREEELDLVLREVCKATTELSRTKSGALIVLAKEVPLSEFIETGVPLDAKVTSELIQTVFAPNTLLHDGGLIIQNGRIIAAGCLFPLTQKHDLDRMFGTRHRAALGISEITDAIVIVVSEERQDISVVYHGKLYRDLGEDELLVKMKELIKKKHEHE
ncbi:MAG TPA: diadenylate cyclase CdaA [Candidatus Omnitrophota bacterium]|nr:diadenylate cyclase CdaA [Candidatus Omnitrophota bacterium]